MHDTPHSHHLIISCSLVDKTAAWVWTTRPQLEYWPRITVFGWEHSPLIINAFSHFLWCWLWHNFHKSWYTKLALFNPKPFPITGSLVQSLHAPHCLVEQCHSKHSIHLCNPISHHARQNTHTACWCCRVCTVEMRIVYSPIPNLALLVVQYLCNTQLRLILFYVVKNTFQQRREAFLEEHI